MARISKYEQDNIESKYYLETYILHEFKPLMNISSNLNNDLSPVNKELYFCSLYYNLLFIYVKKSIKITMMKPLKKKRIILVIMNLMINKKDIL